jgi:hypothetical protein
MRESTESQERDCEIPRVTYPAQPPDATISRGVVDGQGFGSLGLECSNTTLSDTTGEVTRESITTPEIPAVDLFTLPTMSTC